MEGDMVNMINLFTSYFSKGKKLKLCGCRNWFYQAAY
jgi:hypothetical protein